MNGYAGRNTHSDELTRRVCLACALTACAASDHSHALQGLVQQRSKMLDQVPADVESEAKQVVETLSGQLERVQFAIDRKDPDKTSVATAAALSSVSRLEILQVLVSNTCRDD